MDDVKTTGRKLLMEYLEKHGGPWPGQMWTHYKGGNYIVVGTSIMEDTLEPLVHYWSCLHHTVTTRRLSVWYETVGDKPRFRLLSFCEEDVPQPNYFPVKET